MSSSSSSVKDDGIETSVKLIIIKPASREGETEKRIRVDLSDLKEDRPTYNDLREYCLRNDMFGSEYWLKQAGKDGKRCLPDEHIDLDNNEIALYIPPVKVRIMHRPLGQTEGGAEDDQLDVDFFHSFDRVLKDWCKSTHMQLAALEGVEWSCQGRRVEMGMTIKNLLGGAHPGLDDDVTIVGKLTVRISDLECDLEHTIEVYDTERIDDVMRRYTIKAKRVDRLRKIEGDSNKPGARLKIGSGEQEGLELSLNRTVYDCKLSKSKDGPSILLYETDPFEVIIEDETEVKTRVEVRESDTISKLKNLYSQRILQVAPQIEMSMSMMEDDDEVEEAKRRSRLVPLTEKDHLTMDTTGKGGQMEVLDENKHVFTYQIEPGSRIVVDREDLSQVCTTYMCADCGRDVRLRSGDDVRCRACGHRILYKKRTTDPEMPMQYQAR
jgi:DNA-directed RNA polymerase subunit RPC12/RpoP